MIHNLAYEEKVEQIRENLDSVKSRMKDAAERSDRNFEDIKLIAVSKLMPLDVIRAGIEAGITRFGENYPEQAAEKISALAADASIEWHMIGHIQSRKTDTVCEYFDIVHSVDRMKIARYLDRYSRERGRVMPILIEVNLSGEKSKYGWQASDEAGWQDLIPQFRQISELQNIEIRGLMSMPPFFENPALTRPIYKRLREFQQMLQEAIPDVHWNELSIGTSFDFEVAIQEGATMVRVGTEIFGPRPKA